MITYCLQDSGRHITGALFRVEDIDAQDNLGELTSFDRPYKLTFIPSAVKGGVRLREWVGRPELLAGGKHQADVIGICCPAVVRDVLENIPHPFSFASRQKTKLPLQPARGLE